MYDMMTNGRGEDVWLQCILTVIAPLSLAEGGPITVGLILHGLN